MKSYFRFFAAMFVFAVAWGEPESPPASSEVMEEIQSLESLPPDEALKHYRQLMRFNKRFEDDANSHLARNRALISWLPGYFKESPVLFENMKEREAIILTVQKLPAEWAVRFLSDLVLDDRPMKSNEYDYDAPDFEKKMRAEKEALGDSDDTGTSLFQKYGYGPPGGDNQRFAARGLLMMNLAGAPDSEAFRVRSVSVSQWLRLPAQSGRIPEIVEATWGERAILNKDLGLERDNKPIQSDAAGTAGTGRSARENPSAGIGATDESEPSEGTAKKGSNYALFLACGLLAAGLAAVGWRRMKAG